MLISASGEYGPDTCALTSAGAVKLGPNNWGQLADGTTLILDAGSGIRELGQRLLAREHGELHICLTLLHLDHVLGPALHDGDAPGAGLALPLPAALSGAQGSLRRGGDRVRDDQQPPLIAREGLEVALGAG